jgi:hypothetical protein
VPEPVVHNFAELALVLELVVRSFVEPVRVQVQVLVHSFVGRALVQVLAVRILVELVRVLEPVRRFVVLERVLEPVRNFVGRALVDCIVVAQVGPVDHIHRSVLAGQRVIANSCFVVGSLHHKIQ